LRSAWTTQPTCLQKKKRAGEWERWGKIYQANTNYMKAEIPVMAILISDETDFKLRNINRNKEEHF
jgi:hypothetical protein